MGKRKSKHYHNDLQIIVSNNEAIRENEERANKKHFHTRDLVRVNPKTETQNRLFKAYYSGYHCMLTGYAGTGKTFLSMYLALTEVLDEATPYRKLIIVRSNVPTRDTGHLPGDIEEKMAIYELPYVAICNELFPFSRSYENLKKNGYVEFVSTSFIRGITLSDCIVLVDESENMNFHELDSVITRVGDNCKIIFSGDIRQTDLIKNRHDVTGLGEFHKIINRMPSDFATIEFSAEDIVRSSLVKSYILNKADLE